MRLFEVEGRFTNDLIMVLRNLKTPSDLTYPAISNLMKNMGYGEITPQLMKNMYDNNDDLKKIIKDPAESGKILALKTDQEKQSSQIGQLPGPNIDQMAKQGSNAYQKNIG
jgi:hypothetical protein